MAIIQHLVVDEYGAFIGKHSERILVSKGNETLVQAPLVHLEAVIIANHGVSISADAVRECAERGIPIFFLSGSGIPYAGLYSTGLTGTIATRRAQLAAYHTRRGLDLVLALGSGKLQNQANLIRIMAKTRKAASPDLAEALNRTALEIQDQILALQSLGGNHDRAEPLTVEALRQEILGIEGRAATLYWEAVRRVLPEKYAFPGRVGRGAQDAINAALNYGYGVLYGQVERALLLAGLDPYGGFLHADRPGKPSLTLDFVEEFRPVVVDRTVLGMASKGIPFTQEKDSPLLTQNFRRMLVERIYQRLEATVAFAGKSYPLRAVIQMQARHMATFLRGERETYQPFVMAW